MSERVSSAASDLHAADGRYHVAYMTSIMSSRSAGFVSRKKKDHSDDENFASDTALGAVVLEISKDKSRIWNSAEIFTFYRQNGGKKQRLYLIQNIASHFGENVAILT